MSPHRTVAGERHSPTHVTVLRYLAGLALLLLFLAAGELLSRYARVPLPGSVIGMVLLTGALHLRLLRSHWVAPAASLLIRNMGLFFVPPGVGLMVHFGLIRREWLPIGAGALASILAVLVTVGLLQQRLERR